MRLNFKPKRILTKIVVVNVAIIMILSVLSGTVVWVLFQYNTIENTAALGSTMVQQMQENIESRTKNCKSFLINYKINYEMFKKFLNNDEITESAKEKGMIELFNSVHYSMPEVSVLYALNLENEIFTSHDSESDENYKAIVQYMKEQEEKFKEGWGREKWFTIGSDKQKAYLCFAAYNSIDLKYEGLLCAGIDKSFFTDVYENLEKVQKGSVAVYYKDCPIAISEIYQNVASEIHSKENGEYKNYEIEDRKYLIVKEDGCWQVMYIISNDKLLSGVRIFEKIFVGINCIIMVLAIFVMTQFAKKITNNISLLQKQMKHIGNGKFEVANVPKDIEEIEGLYKSLNKMVIKIQQLFEQNIQKQKKISEIENKALQSELHMLQMQINPHFLYNTLEAVNAYAKINGQEEISEIVINLSRLLQESVGKKSLYVTVEDEIENINKYLKITQLISDQIFDIAIEIDTSVKNCLIPRLILQPLVENSIKYGFASMEERGIICIDAFSENDNLVIKVSDNGCGISEEKLNTLNSKQYQGDLVSNDKIHIGIYSVRRRIALNYGEQYSVQVESSHGTNVVLILPKIYEEEKNESFISR